MFRELKTATNTDERRNSYKHTYAYIHYVKPLAILSAQMLFLLLQPLFKKSKQPERHQGVCKKKMAPNKTFMEKSKESIERLLELIKLLDINIVIQHINSISVNRPRKITKYSLKK